MIWDSDMINGTDDGLNERCELDYRVKSGQVWTSIRAEIDLFCGSHWTGRCELVEGRCECARFLYSMSGYKKAPADLVLTI